MSDPRIGTIPSFFLRTSRVFSETTNRKIISKKNADNILRSHHSPKWAIETFKKIRIKLTTA